MGIKKVNGHAYFSGTSDNPISTKMIIYEVKAGIPNYMTQAEFLKALGVKSIGSGLTCVKNFINTKVL